MDDDYPMTEKCPQCGGEGEFLGVLGKSECFRCRDCGIVFQTHTLSEKDDANEPTG